MLLIEVEGGVEQPRVCGVGRARCSSCWIILGNPEGGVESSS